MNIDRISQLIEFESVAVRTFEGTIGCSNGTIRRAIKNNTDIQSKWLSSIVDNYPHISSEWLLTGKGSMLKSGARKSIEVPEGGLPLVDVSVAAGFGSADFSIRKSDIIARYHIPDFEGKADLMTYVRGNSMLPRYHSGDIVICKIIRESTFIQWNEIHIVATREQGLLIKRINPGPSEESLTLVSDNSSYPPFNIPKVEISGIALVLGCIKFE